MSPFDQALKRGKSVTLTLSRPAAAGLSLCIIAASVKRDLFGMFNRSVTIFISDPDDKEVADVDGIAQRW